MKKLFLITLLSINTLALTAMADDGYPPIKKKPEPTKYYDCTLSGVDYIENIQSVSGYFEIEDNYFNYTPLHLSLKNKMTSGYKAKVSLVEVKGGYGQIYKNIKLELDGKSKTFYIGAPLMELSYEVKTHYPKAATLSCELKKE